MTNPGFTVASADPAEHPELTFTDSMSNSTLPSGCPRLDPQQIAVATATVTISSEETPEAVVGGDLVTVAHDDLPEPVAIDPQEP